MVRAVNNKVLVALSEIGAQQAESTEETAAAIEQLLDYVATYPNGDILLRKSDMILEAHAMNKELEAEQMRTSSYQKMNRNQNSMDQ